MEIALRGDVHTYAGGLGVLAGDTLRSAADIGLPMVGVTLASRQGYSRQEIDPQGWQVDAPDPWEPAELARRLGAKVTVQIGGEDVWIQAWAYLLEGGAGHQVPVILLDTDVPENTREARRITDSLYGGDRGYRFRQEMVLGIGGVRVLRALGFDVYGYHLNEGHSALLGLELGRQFQHPEERRQAGQPSFDLDEVRRRCVFTTHTPVEAAHDRFDYALIEPLIGDSFGMADLRLLGGDRDLNMTALALNLSGYVNGVAKRHAELSAQMFPGYHVHAITNGVHPGTWVCPGFAALFDAQVPTWRHEPELLVRVDRAPDEEVWNAHEAARSRLREEVRRCTGVALDPALPVIGFARRMTGYKRPDLLFTDLERLRSIHGNQPFHVVIAGKAHPRDTEGKALIKQIHDHIRELDGAPQCVFLPDYDLPMAQWLIPGADVWLNTPLPPMEASGTSGMKAAFNGVLNLSVLDGWWLEGCIEGVTGWAIGNGESGPKGGDANALYDKLEQVVLPAFADRAGWVWMMKQAVAKNAYYFNSHRMMRRYVTDAYMRFP